eukprot:3174324-Amphidinium_carterae.2
MVPATLIRCLREESRSQLSGHFVSCVCVCVWVEPSGIPFRNNKECKQCAVVHLYYWLLVGFLTVEGGGALLLNIAHLCAWIVPVSAVDFAALLAVDGA